MILPTDSEHDVRYKKVLICSLSRMNAIDSSSNNLLLRNLFHNWPRQNLAQIFSGGSNEDRGFCGQFYQIGACDRRFGDLFVKIKRECSYNDHSQVASETSSIDSINKIKFNSLLHSPSHFMKNSGLYELLFKLRPSQELLQWVEAFDPDVIFAQGYNLTFSWLPVFLKQRIQKPLVYYCSDDWPSYLYAQRKGLQALTAPIMRVIVEKAAQQLFAATDAAFSFNDIMGEEYKRRYGREFTTLMHCDDPERFERAEPVRTCSTAIKSIVACGSFDDSRWPLLLDLEEACSLLNDAGIPTRATVFITRISDNGFLKAKSCRHLELKDDPGHELLPSYLKGADLLFLPETFDTEVAEGYRYSISTKAHLFMFSERPILVYGHAICGVVSYAQREEWASVVNVRDPYKLYKSLHLLLQRPNESESRILLAKNLAMKNNDCSNIKSTFKCVIDRLNA